MLDKVERSRSASNGTPTCAPARTYAYTPRTRAPTHAQSIITCMSSTRVCAHVQAAEISCVTRATACTRAPTPTYMEELHSSKHSVHKDGTGFASVLVTTHGVFFALLCFALRCVKVRCCDLLSRVQFDADTWSTRSMWMFSVWECAQLPPRDARRSMAVLRHCSVRPSAAQSCAARRCRRLRALPHGQSDLSPSRPLARTAGRSSMAAGRSSMACTARSFRFALAFIFWTMNRRPLQRHSFARPRGLRLPASSQRA